MSNWTEQDYQEIVARLKRESQGVGDVPEAESLDGISSLPAYQEVEGQDIPNIRRAPLTLLAAPALEAAEKANEAATNAGEKASAAEAATQAATEAASNTNEAIQNAKTATDAANASASSANQATENANTAASNANSKATLADTAAANANETAEHPTYIGTDHYVYVYNKETKTFDKTNIYCKGEPGAPFKPVGQYDTLELLKQAIPDGSDIDGVIAVGTEAPYDYYAWVDGEWVNQGKIGGIDEAPSDGNTYGRKNEDWVEVLEKSKTVEYIRDLREADLDTFRGDTGADIAFIGVQRNNKFATPERHYPIEEAGTLIVTGTITGKTNQTYHTYNSNRIFIRCATSSGSTGEFSDWAELAKVTDVLTKTNTSSFTPTGDYQPATKKYVDGSLTDNRNVGYMMRLTEIDASGLDENTWYPVVMSLGDRNTARIEVLVALDSGSHPSWATHSSGFSVRKIWEVNGDGWGTNPYINRQIFVSDYQHADIDPVRGINQLTYRSEEYVFVRGGGKYFFYTSHKVIPELKTETHEGASGQSVSPTTETPAEIVANMATKKYVDENAGNKTKIITSNNLYTWLRNNTHLSGLENVIPFINALFGNLETFTDIVNKLASHELTGLIFENCTYDEISGFYVGGTVHFNNIYSYVAGIDNEFNLYATYSYSTGFKCISIFLSDAYTKYEVVIKDLVSSDNLTTVTKMASADYEALETKDDKTMYAVTD